MSVSNHSTLTPLSKLLCRRIADALANGNTNPFRALTPQAASHSIPEGRRDIPPHFRQLRPLSLNYPPSESSSSDSSPASPPHCSLHEKKAKARSTIREKTMAGIPPWPSDLKLSLNSSNWLEWSRHLLTSLQMGQLDQYPLGLLARPAHDADLLCHGRDVHPTWVKSLYRDTGCEGSGSKY